MVHLSTVSRGESPDLAPADTPTQADAAGEVTTTVYGSRWAMEDLPKHRIPESEMPPGFAYKMIKEELALDGNPVMNLASFCTTYMEDEAERLMTEALPKNFIDYEEYPQTAEIQHRCVNMLADLFNAPRGTDAVGTSTIGSSEAIMLAVLAMKRRWMHANGLVEKPDPSRRPNLVMSSVVQVCWEKAVRYLDVEPKIVNCDRDRFVLDPEQAVDLVDENTIGVCLIFGTTYTGEYEDVRSVNNLLVERGLDVGIHVDAASGGFVAPFVNPELEWDFRLEKVVSINVSGHKYGLVYPGVGWIIWRSATYLPSDLVFNINYLGADQATFTLNFSKGASHVIGQYYQLIRLGRHGFRCIMSNLTRTADHLTTSLAAMGFIILSKSGGKGLPLVAFRFAVEGDYAKDEDTPLLFKPYDEFALAHQLRARGWVVPAYTMAPNVSYMRLLRVVVREDFSHGRCAALISDIKLCITQLDKMKPAEIERHNTLVRQSTMKSGNSTHNHPNYKNESHSMQGKHGKTNGVC